MILAGIQNCGAKFAGAARDDERRQIAGVCQILRRRRVIGSVNGDPHRVAGPAREMTGKVERVADPAEPVLRMTRNHNRIVECARNRPGASKT